MTAQPTIGFIGYGNMAQAIARGLTTSGAVEADHIEACAAHYDKLERTTAELGVKPLHTPAEVVSAADIVVIAIKPYQIEAVLTSIKAELADPSISVISIAGGWTLAQYRTLLGEHAHVQCAVPNTPIAVGQGILVTERDHTLDDGQTRQFEAIFSSIANIERVESEHMGIAVDLAGCAPAFTAMYIESLADAGVEYGLQRATAYRLAAKMVEGVGALHLATGTHPGAMKDAVCSPGGTTIKGVASLERTGFRGAVIAAIEAIEG